MKIGIILPTILYGFYWMWQTYVEATGKVVVFQQAADRILKKKKIVINKKLFIVLYMVKECVLCGVIAGYMIMNLTK